MIEEIHQPGMVQPASNDNSPILYTDETLLWSGRPSQWVNFALFTVWVTTFVTAAVLLILWNLDFKTQYPPAYQQIIPIIAFSIMLFAVLFITVAYLSVANELTSITANKIEESTGIISIFRQKKYCEISDITDINSPPPGILGLFGLSTVVILANDDDQPEIRIRAIKDRDQLIAMLMPVWRQLRMDRRAYFESQ